MCDIQPIGCKVCGTLIEIHLGDWDTSLSEIEVFCKDHIPKNNVVVWQSTPNGSRRGVKSMCEKNTYSKVGIRALTDNARLNKDANHPNTTDSEIIEER